MVRMNSVPVPRWTWPNLKVINLDRFDSCAFCVLKAIGLGQCPADIKTERSTISLDSVGLKFAIVAGEWKRYH
jgi:hypothetical protein